MGKQKQELLQKIESFHWEPANSREYRLVYFDENELKTETLISKAQLESALKLFTGKPHLIKRSTGAYSPATPSQLLIYDIPKNSKDPQLRKDMLRVNAKFVDFERDSAGNIKSEKLVAHFKNVPPSAFRLLDPDTDPFKHQYWIETGNEIIPVSVFDFYRTESNIIKALFVKTRDLQLISDQSRGKKQKIAIYSAPEAVLRVSLPEEVNDVIEFHTFSRSLRELSIGSKKDIPAFLKFGPDQTIPTGSPMQVLNQYLRICQDPHAGAMKRAVLDILENPRESEDTRLLPFGLFERA